MELTDENKQLLDKYVESFEKKEINLTHFIYIIQELRYLDY